VSGFHLSGDSYSEIEEIIEVFRNLAVQKIAPSHCSGDNSRKLAKKKYRQDCILSGVGGVIAF